MHLNSDISSALQQMETIKKVIEDSDDENLQLCTEDSLKIILDILQDPVFRSIIQIEDSLSALNNQIVQHPSILPNDFDINVSGELILNVPPPHLLYDNEYTDDQQRTPTSMSPLGGGGGGGQQSPSINSPTLPLQHKQQQPPLPSVPPPPSSMSSTTPTSTTTVSHDNTNFINSTSNTDVDAINHLLMLTTAAEQEQQHQQQQLNILKKSRSSGGGSGYSDSLTHNTDDERPHSTVSDSSKHIIIDILNAEWAQIQSLELVNDGTGLGFGIIGARTSGVIVKTILAGGVADRDGRLMSGDHILQIGDVNLHDMVSEQVASVLRQSGTHVRLVVARPIDPCGTIQLDVEGTAIVPARLLSDPNELERYLMAAGYGDIFGNVSPSSTPTQLIEHFMFNQNTGGISSTEGGGIDEKNLHKSSVGHRPQMSIPTDNELPETEKFTVELTKDVNGLGITIAGYVCEKEELSGIFVKSVSSGSAADISGKIYVNDRIIEVDGQPLHGFSNHQAVDVLKKSGTSVTLCLERYLRGPKFEQLKEAIAANSEMKPPTQTNNQQSITLTPGRPHSIQSIGNRDENNLRQSSFHVATTPTMYYDNNNDDTDVDQNIGTLETNYHQQNQNVGLTKSMAHNTSNVPVGIVSANNSIRKLVHARDSIETKIEKDIHNDGNNDHGLQISSKLPPPPPPTLSSPINEQQQHSGYIQTTTTSAGKHKYWIEPELTSDIENSIRNRWRSVLGLDAKIIVAQIRKFAASSGLGISLEGTVDVEGGQEVRPHHYIRSILLEGPVGRNGLLRSGDELLEVNGQRLLGMNHLDVVAILKELPQDVRMVCCRGEVEMLPFTEENIRKSLGFGGSQNLENLLPASERLVKAKSDGSLATSGSTTDESFTKLKSRSLEPLSGLAMWSSDPQIIELIKGERGLGFSILDYQDPLDANNTLIVIRSLVPGGVAQLDGRLIPGDRLLFVNDINLENSSLDQAVQALKGAAKGIVRIGVAKPLPMTDTTTMNLSQNHSEYNISGGGGGGGVVAAGATGGPSELFAEPDLIPEWKSK